MLGVAARGPKWLFERQTYTIIVQDSLVREDVLLVDGAFCCCQQQNDVEASLLDGEAVLVAHGVALCGRRQIRRVRSRSKSLTRHPHRACTRHRGCGLVVPGVVHSEYYHRHGSLVRSIAPQVAGSGSQ